MPSRRLPSRKASPADITLMFLGVIAFMYFAGEVLKPLALAILLSFSLGPVASLFERKLKLPRVVAVVSSVVVALGLLSGVGYVVGQQLTQLVAELPNYQSNIESKIGRITALGHTEGGDRLGRMVESVTAKLSTPVDPASERPQPPQKVEVVSRPNFQERLREAVGPYLEFLGVGSVVLVLVIFMLLKHDDLRDRLVGLFGRRVVGLTTHTLDEIDQRISRYLGTFVMVNSGFGLVIGLGMWAIGIPYAALWGVLAGLLRFIPYVGPAAAFAMPLVFSVAHFEGWHEPLLMIALFGVVETILNSFLEPVIYGKSTGVSALGLLVAALFWTWLWGLAGLLLSTPLTVCLAVLGKYVPSLRFLAILLGEDAEVGPAVRLYHRLVGLDRPGAAAVMESVAKEKPRAEIYDEVFLPVLSQARRDAADGHLDISEQTFLWKVMTELLENGEATKTGETQAESVAAGEGNEVRIVGLPARDRSDVLALEMVRDVLPGGVDLEAIEAGLPPLQLAARLMELSPNYVLISHVLPGGLAKTRYLVRRLRAQSPDLPIIVGCWGGAGSSTKMISRIEAVGATKVLVSLEEAREYFGRAIAPAQSSRVETAPLPA